MRIFWLKQHIPFSATKARDWDALRGLEWPLADVDPPDAEVNTNRRDDRLVCHIPLIPVVLGFTHHDQ